MQAKLKKLDVLFFKRQNTHIGVLKIIVLFAHFDTRAELFNWDQRRCVMIQML